MRALNSLASLAPTAEDARSALAESFAAEVAGLSGEHAKAVLDAALEAAAIELRSVLPAQRDSVGRIRGFLAWVAPVALEAAVLAQRSMGTGCCRAEDARRADELEQLIGARLSDLQTRDRIAASWVAEAAEAARASCEATRTCGDRLGMNDLVMSIRIERPADPGATGDPAG